MVQGGRVVQGGANTFAPSSIKSFSGVRSRAHCASSVSGLRPCYRVMSTLDGGEAQILKRDGNRRVNNCTRRRGEEEGNQIRL